MKIRDKRSWGIKCHFMSFYVLLPHNHHSPLPLSPLPAVRSPSGAFLRNSSTEKRHVTFMDQWVLHLFSPHVLPKPFALVSTYLPRMQPNSALVCLIPQIPVPELWKDTGRPPSAPPAPCSTTDHTFICEWQELTLMVSLLRHLPSTEITFSNWFCDCLSSL